MRTESGRITSLARAHQGDQLHRLVVAAILVAKHHPAMGHHGIKAMSGQTRLIWLRTGKSSNEALQITLISTLGGALELLSGGESGQRLQVVAAFEQLTLLSRD